MLVRSASHRPISTIYPSPSDSTASVKEPSNPNYSDLEISQIKTKLKAPLIGILQTTKNPANSSYRKDSHGMKIDRKLRLHRISFKDNYGGDLCDIYSVKSYKKYNVWEQPSESCTSCGCKIF